MATTMATATATAVATAMETVTVTTAMTARTITTMVAMAKVVTEGAFVAVARCVLYGVKSLLWGAMGAFELAVAMVMVVGYCW